MTRTNFYQRKVVGCYLIQHRETLRSYCGQSRDVLSRWRAHCSGGKKATGIGAAIRDEGVDSFTFRVLEECDVSQLNEREVFWIAHYDCVEPHGYNRNSGGGAPTYVSAATKAKISASKIGNTGGAGKTPWNKGGTLSPETCEKMSASLKGKNKGKVHSPEQNERQRQRLLGKVRGPHSPETIEKIRVSNLGKTRSPETCAKLKGRTLSPETIAKRSESRRRNTIARKAARAAAAETSSYSEPLLEALQSLRTDKQYVAMDSGSTPLSVAPAVAPPTLAELEEILSWL